MTDNNGSYFINDVPSGDYEVVIVLDTNIFPGRNYKVHASGIPFNVDGERIIAPLIEIYKQE